MKGCGLRRPPSEGTDADELLLLCAGVAVRRRAAGPDARLGEGTARPASGPALSSLPYCWPLERLKRVAEFPADLFPAGSLSEQSSQEAVQTAVYAPATAAFPAETRVPNPSSNQRPVRGLRGLAYFDGFWDVRVEPRFETLAAGSFGQVSVRGRQNPFCAPITDMDTSTPLGTAFADQSSGFPSEVLELPTLRRQDNDERPSYEDVNDAERLCLDPALRDALRP
jgi:hypothetical protein